MSFYVWKENSESMQRKRLGRKLKLKPLGAVGKVLNYVTKINPNKKIWEAVVRGAATI